MKPEVFQNIYPYVHGWIEQTLRNHVQWTRTVACAKFKRLPLYFSPEFLDQAKYVVVETVPVPPLAALGMPQFAEFERMEAGGITYRDTYFIRKECALSERIHFHELIHVVQWLALGPEKFMMTYAEGLEKFGYRQSPLEVMAYEAEDEFVNGAPVFDAQRRVEMLLKHH